MQGIAVVAESRGEIEEAQRWYESAAQRAEPFYPQLAVWARQRSSTADVYAQPITLPKNDQLPAAPPPESLEPASIDDALRPLLLPD